MRAGFIFLILIFVYSCRLNCTLDSVISNTGGILSPLTVRTHVATTMTFSCYDSEPARTDSTEPVATRGASCLPLLELFRSVPTPHILLPSADENKRLVFVDRLLLVTVHAHCFFVFFAKHECLRRRWGTTECCTLIPTLT